MPNQIILHKIDPSPPARAVMMVLDLLGLKTETRDVNILRGDHQTAEYLEKNPLHTVPLLEEGDFILQDSHAILIYLVSKYGADQRERLYSNDLRIRATLHQRLFFDNSILFPRLRVVVGSILLGHSTGPTEEQTAEIEEAYGFTEKYLEASTFLVTSHLTLADISCVATISTLNALVPIHPKYEKLIEWLNKLKECEFYKNVNEPGLAQFEALISYFRDKNSK